jgi:uncharacterized protein YoxC
MALMIVADRDWFDTTVGIAHALNSLVLLALVIVLIPLAIALTKNVKDLRAFLDKLQDDIRPITGHAKRISANVEEISDSVKDEVRQVKQTVGQATRGLHTAVESTEKRLRDFGALMDVAQSEAERVVVGTATAARGVRAVATAVTNAIKGDGNGRDGGEAGERKSRGTPQVRRRRKRGR